MIWDRVDHFLSLSVTLLQPFLTLATSQTNVRNAPLPESFRLCSFSCLELFSSQSYLYFIQVWAQISTPQRNLTEHPILLFCLPLHHVVLFHCHLLLLNLNLQPLLHFFIICFGDLNVGSMWAVAALFTSVPQSLEQCLNIAGSQKFVLTDNDDDEDSHRNPKFFTTVPLQWCEHTDQYMCLVLKFKMYTSFSYWAMRKYFNLPITAKGLSYKTQRIYSSSILFTNASAD